jgi:hypothetical protein
MKTQEIASRALYAAVGAPVVATRKAREYGAKLVELTGRVADGAHEQFDELATEGEKVVGQIKSRNVVEDIQSRVDLDKVQGKVDQLRDQLESALSAWRESFTPEVRPKPTATKAAATKAKPAATKAAATRKATTRKPSTSTKPSAG